MSMVYALSSRALISEGGAGVGSVAVGLTAGVLAVIKRERAGRDQRTLKPPDRGRAAADAYRKYLIALASAFYQPLCAFAVPISHLFLYPLSVSAFLCISLLHRHSA